MKNYTDIKIARSDLRKLTEIYQYCVAKKEKLKASLTDNESFDVRCESYVYRLGLNEMKKKIIEIKKNIKRLDRETAKRDLERLKKEFN